MCIGKKKGIPLVGQKHTPPSSWSWDSKDSKLPIKWRRGCRSRKTLKMIMDDQFAMVVKALRCIYRKNYKG
jgi:hypothetical protein